MVAPFVREGEGAVPPAFATAGRRTAWRKKRSAAGWHVFARRTLRLEEQLQRRHDAADGREKGMDWQNMVFQGWPGIFRTLIVGTLAYAALVLFLRISGKRTLSKLNAFDLVVTVALGSTLSSILLQETIALAEGAAALGLLILLQYLVTFASVRSRRVAHAIRSEPSLLVRSGSFCHGAMKQQRLTEDEIMSAVRSHGHRALAEIDAVVLESDGTLSIIKTGQ
jgi:hypothetical protein